MSMQADIVRQFTMQRPQSPGMHRWPHVTVVASGKGGTGTSTVAALLAVAAARSGADTLLVDAQETHGSLCTLLGIDVPAGDPTKLHRVGPLLQLSLPGAASLETMARSAAERRVLFRRVAARFSEFECVIVDAGARVDDVLAALLGGAGRLLAVTTGDRIALAATYALLKVVTARMRGVRVELIANHCDDVEGIAAFSAVRGGAERFLHQPIGFAAAIPSDSELHQLIEAGALLTGGSSSASQALEPLALHLTAPPLRAAGVSHLP